MVEILSAQNLNATDEANIVELFRQLSPHKKQFPIGELLNEHNPLHFACYRDQHRIVGIASMCTYKVISGYKGWIEDVVVDVNQRGKGIGEELIKKLIELGQQLGLTEIFLFTEDEKKAAIGLYTKLGFVQKQSRLYHLKMLRH